MGSYKIIIKGLGCHHNKGNMADADKMAFQFAHDLKMAGHEISEAIFTYNYSEDNLLKIGGCVKSTDQELIGKGKSIALTMEQIASIENNDETFEKTGQSSWTNENFKKLIDTAKVLYAELGVLKNKMTK
jgi:hypothetical protein